MPTSGAVHRIAGRSARSGSACRSGRCRTGPAPGGPCPGATAGQKKTAAGVGGVAERRGRGRARRRRPSRGKPVELLAGEPAGGFVAAGEVGADAGEPQGRAGVDPVEQLGAGRSGATPERVMPVSTMTCTSARRPTDRAMRARSSAAAGVQTVSTHPLPDRPPRSCPAGRPTKAFSSGRKTMTGTRTVAAATAPAASSRLATASGVGRRRRRAPTWHRPSRPGAVAEARRRPGSAPWP